MKAKPLCTSINRFFAAKTMLDGALAKTKKRRGSKKKSAEDAHPYEAWISLLISGRQLAEQMVRDEQEAKPLLKFLNLAKESLAWDDAVSSFWIELQPSLQEILILDRIKKGDEKLHRAAPKASGAVPSRFTTIDKDLELLTKFEEKYPRPLKLGDISEFASAWNMRRDTMSKKLTRARAFRKSQKRNRTEA